MLHLSAFESAGASEFYKSVDVGSWHVNLYRDDAPQSLSPGEVLAVRNAVQDAWSGGSYKSALVTETLVVGRYCGTLAADLEIRSHGASPGQAGLTTTENSKHKITGQLEYLIREVEVELGIQSNNRPDNAFMYWFRRDQSEDEHERVLKSLKSIRARLRRGLGMPPPNLLNIRLGLGRSVGSSIFKLYLADDDYFMVKMLHYPPKGTTSAFRCDGTRGVVRLLADNT